MILSKFRSAGVLTKRIFQPQFVRNMSEERTFPLAPSRFGWSKFKDFVHFYFMLGLIPATLAIGYVNIFVGPATLSEIPDGYTPKYWEYYNHPITRFIAKNLTLNPQKEYEKYLAYTFMEEEKRMLRQLEKEIIEKIKTRGDYQAYYYRPVLAKYHRQSKKASDYVESILGD